MLYVANNKYPNDYLLPVYTCWGLAGVMAVCIIVIPESPWFYARQGRQEDALKSLRSLNKGVKGYDFEEEVGIIFRTLAHEKVLNEALGKSEWRDVFTGVNLVSRYDFSGAKLTGRKRRTILVVMCWSGGQWAGLSMIGTYSTCELGTCLMKTALTCFVDFFSIAGLNDPFLASLIVS